MFQSIRTAGYVAAIVSLCLLQHAQADDVVLTLKDHRFIPENLILPANQKTTLVVRNLDATPAEFESTDLNREKIVRGSSDITLIIGPLTAGSYHFFDDFHRDQAVGTIVVR